MIDEKLAIVKDTCSQLMVAAVTESELNSHVEFLEELENVHREAKELLQERIANLQCQSTNRAVPESGSAATQYTEKLQAMSIPRFDGTNWSEFRRVFEEMVHRREDLTNSGKLTRLQQHVDRDKVKALGHATDYQEVWQELVEQYDDPKGEIRRLLTKFQSMALSPANTRTNIEAVITQARVLMRAMKANGVSPSTALQHDIVNRLPQEAAAYWELTYGEQTLDLPEMLRKLQIYARTLKHDPLPESRLLPERRDVQPPRRNYHAFAAVMDSGCVFCRGPHAHADCLEFRNRSVEERRELVARARACFQCLSPGHRVRQCRRRSCTNCGNTHHQLLCGRSSAGGPRALPSGMAALPSAGQGGLNA